MAPYLKTLRKILVLTMYLVISPLNNINGAKCTLEVAICKTLPSISMQKSLFFLKRNKLLILLFAFTFFLSNYEGKKFDFSYRKEAGIFTNSHDSRNSSFKKTTKRAQGLQYNFQELTTFVTELD